MSVVDTTPQALFGSNGKYYAQASISYSKDPKNKQFTVKVNGVRVYSKYGYNFKSYLTCKLGDTEDTGEIGASGNNDYTGWLPSSGYNNSINISKTFNYNSDGTVPKVSFYLRAYNNSVKWLNKGVYISANTSVDTNIDSHIGALDVSAPTFNLSKSTESIGSIGFSTSTTNGYKVNLWQVQVDDGTVLEYTGETGISKSYTVSSATHVIKVRARNSYNNVWSGWQKVDCDCRIPNIKSLSLTPLSVNSGKLKFSSDYNCKWRLSGNGIDTGWKPATTSVDTNITVAYNNNCSYTLEVKRNNNGNLSNSTTVSCNTILPSLTINSISTLGNTMTVSASSTNVKCNNWKLNYSSATDSGNTSNNSSSYGIEATLRNLKFNEPYTITVTATNESNGLSNSVTSTGHTCIGCIRLFPQGKQEGVTDASKGVLASVFIHNGSEWKGAVPYVHDGTQWRQCT